MGQRGCSGGGGGGGGGLLCGWGTSEGASINHLQTEASMSVQHASAHPASAVPIFRPPAHPPKGMTTTTTTTTTTAHIAGGSLRRNRTRVPVSHGE